MSSKNCSIQRSPLPAWRQTGNSPAAACLPVGGPEEPRPHADTLKRQFYLT